MSENPSQDDIKRLYDRAEEAFKSAQKAQEASQELREAAQQAKSEADAALSAANQAKGQVEGLAGQVRENAGLVSTSKEQADTATGHIKALQKNKDKIEQDLTALLERLQNAVEESERLETKINEILPGATGIGLSESFSTRRSSLKGPAIFSNLLFIVSIIGIVVAGAWLIGSLGEGEDLLEVVLLRLPLFAGFILLEEFSRRRVLAIQRLDEDYAYKESVSLAFEGFRRVVSDVQDADGSNAAAGSTGSGQDAQTPSLLQTLTMNLLNVLSERPGRLLEDTIPQNSGDKIDLLTTLSSDDSKDSAVSRNTVNMLLERLSLRERQIKLTTLGLGAGLFALGYWLATTLAA